MFTFISRYNFNLIILGIGTKIMLLDADMFCTWFKLWRLGYLDAALVILKHSAFDLRQGKIKVEIDTKLHQ